MQSIVRHGGSWSLTCPTWHGMHSFEHAASQMEEVCETTAESTVGISIDASREGGYEIEHVRHTHTHTYTHIHAHTRTYKNEKTNRSRPIHVSIALSKKPDIWNIFLGNRHALLIPMNRICACINAAARNMRAKPH